jgi:hypothetical protein
MAAIATTWINGTHLNANLPAQRQVQGGARKSGFLSKSIFL